MVRTLRDNDDDMSDRIADAVRRAGVSVDDVVRSVLTDGRRTRTTPKSRDDDDIAGRNAWRGEHSREDELNEIGAAVRRLSDVGGRNAETRGRDNRRADAILDTLDALDRRIRTLAEDRDPQARRPARQTSSARAAGIGGSPDYLRRAIAEISDRQSALDDVPARPAPRRAAIDRDDADERYTERSTARRGGSRAETRSRAHDEPRSRSSYDEPRSSGFQQMEPHFRALAEKIDQIRKRDEDGLLRPVIDEIRSLRETVESRGKDADVDVGGELKRLGRLVERAAETHGAGSVSIEPLVAEIGRLREVVLQSNVEGSLRSLEAGYGHIVERLDEMRRGTLDTRGIDQLGAEIAKIRDALGSVPKVNQISALERNLADIGRMLVRDHASVDPRIDEVANRIDDLKRALGEANPSPALRSLEERLDLLTGKLDSVERSARGPVSPERMAGLVDELRIIAAGSRTADELRGLERRVAEIGERITDLGRRPGSPIGDAGALANRLDELSAKIDRIQPPSADHQLSLAALDATIDKVDRLIGRSRDGSITAVIEDRLAQLIGTLDRVERDHVGTNADVDALAREVAAMRREMVSATQTPMRAMEAQMQTLAERLERSLADADDDRALEQIEDQLHRITQHLEQTQDRLGDMGAMERAIMRLEERLERRSDDTAAIAREVAEEVLRQRGGDHGPDRGDDPTLTALQADLKMLQNAARTNENRTIDTLQSLHGALVGIADRLNAIETGQNLFGQRGTAEPRPRFTTEPEPAVAATPRRPEPVAVPNEDHRPLEPGSGKPAFTVADVEPPKEAPAEPASPAARKADFIAAARRAAQAAAAASSEPVITAKADERMTAPAGDAPAAESKSRLGVLAQVGDVLRRRRPLVLATAALVLTLIAVRFLPSGGEEPPRPAPQQQQQSERAQPKPDKTSAADPKSGAQIVTGAIAPSWTNLNSSTSMSAYSDLTKGAPDSSLMTGPTTTGSIPGQAATMPSPAGNTLGQTGASPILGAQGAGAQTAPANPVRQVGAGSVPRAETTGSVDAGPANSPAPAQTAEPTQQPIAPSTTVASIAPAGATAPAPNAATPDPASRASVLPEKIGSDKLRSAALRGDPKAALEVGIRYAEGRGVPADAKEAARWFQVAAEKGLATAQYRMGSVLEKGIGVARDLAAAKVWYQKAAENGNVRAMHNLGVLFANDRDMPNAITWFQRAADHGLPDSQFNLGIINALGSGVRQDLAVSYKWFGLAARSGDREAEKKRDDVAAHLDKNTLAAAKMAVQTWQQKPVNRDANEETALWIEPAGATPAESASAMPTGPDAVKAAQQALQQRGVYAGPIDGDMNSRTKQAIRTFQKKMGVKQTGEIDAATLKLLGGKAL